MRNLPVVSRGDVVYSARGGAADVSVQKTKLKKIAGATESGENVLEAQLHRQSITDRKLRIFFPVFFFLFALFQIFRNSQNKH